MRLAPVPQSAASATYFGAYKLGPWELGQCVAPSYYDNGAPTGSECGHSVHDDGTGYADLDGQPFKAYVCGRCAARLLAA